MIIPSRIIEFTWGVSGLVGTLGFRVQRADGTYVAARSTTGFAAHSIDGSAYALTLTNLDTAWSPMVIEIDDGTNMLPVTLDFTTFNAVNDVPASTAEAIFGFALNEWSSIETGAFGNQFLATRTSTDRLTAARASYIDNLNVANLPARFGTLPTTGTVVVSSQLPANFSSLSITGGNIAGTVGGISGVTFPANFNALNNLDVAISTRLAASGYTAPDNAGISAARTAAESANNRIGDGSSASHVARKSDVAAVATDVVDALTGTEITVTSPVSTTGDITLYAGDSYTGSRAIAFNFTGRSGQAIALRIIPWSRYRVDVASADAELVLTATANSTGASFTATASQTAMLGARFPVDSSPTHRYQLIATATEETIAEGDLTATRKITNA